MMHESNINQSPVQADEANGFASNDIGYEDP